MRTPNARLIRANVERLSRIGAFLACLILLVPQLASGEETLEGVLERVQTEHKLPALGAIAFRGNALLERGVSGIRARGHTEPVTSTDKWHLGSLTKSMTATLAAMLVADDRIAWDSNLQDTLGKKFRILPAYQPVTLRELLRHRGGFPAQTTTPFWWNLMRDDGSERRQRSRVLKEVFAMEPATPPRAQASYANLNFVVAGAMLEQASGTAWQELVRERLFDPLKMSSAGFGPPASGRRIDQPWGHTAEGVAASPKERTADNPPVLGPAGTVHCSLNDLARFYAFHLRKGTAVDGSRLLAPSVFDTLHGLDQKDDQWGLGWIKTEREWAGGTALTHSGTNTMNYATVWLAPKRDFGVAIVTNQGGDAAAKACDAVVAALIARHADILPTAKGE